MDYNEMMAKITIEDAQPLKINGVEVSADRVAQWGKDLIWKSSIVAKNKRQTDKGGIKTTIRQAVEKGLIDQEEAFGYVMDGISKDKLNELKDQLPKAEKTVHPNDDDYDVGVKQVQKGGGQRA